MACAQRMHTRREATPPHTPREHAQLPVSINVCRWVHMSAEMGGARAKRCVPILLLGLDACPGLAIVSAALPAARHGRLEGSSGGPRVWTHRVSSFSTRWARLARTRQTLFRVLRGGHTIGTRLTCSYSTIENQVRSLSRYSLTRPGPRVKALTTLNRESARSQKSFVTYAKNAARLFCDRFFTFVVLPLHV